jgi:hypothetical protein
VLGHPRPMGTNKCEKTVDMAVNRNEATIHASEDPTALGNGLTSRRLAVSKDFE